ncbi:MAG: lipopolysaccharide assembly protein LapB [Rhodocyclaceae bacterium]|nr:lipopolysaccharide assembly protein LapB [Rhodocyclaceae bacterium]
MLEIEYWWLAALPAFFALGWAAARIDIRQVIREARNLPKAYFRALNLLVDDDAERATDVLVELARAERGNTELQMALAGLFRRKGETDRAIRIHQSLLAEGGLDGETKQKVTLELALDFLAAGLLDRAEGELRRLLGTPHEARALPPLLNLYAAEREWHKAIETARRLEEITGHPRPQEIAQYWCEVAQYAFNHSDDAGAGAAVAAALAANYKCTRANVIGGQLALRQGDAAGALACWQRVELQNADDLPLVAGLIADTALAQGEAARAANLLRGYWQQTPTVDVLDAALRVVLAVEGEPAARALLAEAVAQRPSILAVSRQLEHGGPPEVSTLRQLLGQHTRRLAQYRCTACGFRARAHYWHCPACSAWETYPARRVEELNIYD